MLQERDIYMYICTQTISHMKMLVPCIIEIYQITLCSYCNFHKSASNQVLNTLTFLFLINI